MKKKRSRNCEYFSVFDAILPPMRRRDGKWKHRSSFTVPRADCRDSKEKIMVMSLRS